MDTGVGISSMKVVESSKKVTMMMRWGDIMLRILGLSLTLTAAIVVGVDKQTKIVSVNTFIKNLPPLHVSDTAKWKYMSAFVYFLVSNAIACSYAEASLAIIRKFQNKAGLGLIILDLTITGLLFSANGAAIAVGIIGLNGNSHVPWIKVCIVFGGFCRQFAAALVMSLVGSFVFLLLVALAILKLHDSKRSR